MSDAAKQTLSLSTIAGCLVIIVPCLFWCGSSYDNLVNGQRQLLDGQTQIVETQKTDHKWLISLSGQVSDHERQLDEILANQGQAATKAEAETIRQKKYEDNSNN